MAEYAEFTELLAETVLGVPGVAFLKPGVGGRLRSALVGGVRAGPTVAGLRVRRPTAAEPWRVEVQIVTRADARALDVARAARTAIDVCLTAVAAEPAQVTVTVTGTV